MLKKTLKTKSIWYLQLGMLIILVFIETYMIPLLYDPY